MKIFKASAIAAAVMFSVAQATAAFACPHSPYSGPNVPPVTLTGTVTAAQNVYLYPNSSIYSPNGVYRLIFQTDGNLVLYKNGTQVIWDTNTEICAPSQYVPYATRFQSDGNLVVYYSLWNNPLQPVGDVWDANTQGHPNSRLVVQDDGNVVIYDSNNKVLWAIRR